MGFLAFFRLMAERGLLDMKVYDAASIRNVAIVGHSGSGKTQLASAILFDAGMVNRLGKVDEGNTVTDFDEEEIARKHTLSASISYAEWNKTKINIIDTPGFANFFSDARAALGVADGALVVIDAVSGVEVQTEKVWEEAEAQELPRMVVLSRMDRERASLSRTLEAIQASFGRMVVPIQMPIGAANLDLSDCHQPGPQSPALVAAAPSFRAGVARCAPRTA